MVIGPELLDYTTPANRLEGNDCVLWPFFEAEDQELCDRSLDHLLTQEAFPVIKRVFDLLHRRHSSQGLYPVDFEDVAQEVAMGLIRRLRILKQNPELDSIKDYANYVARATSNAYNRKILENHPKRLILRNQAEYLFSQDPMYSSWLDDKKSLLCGFASWHNSPSQVVTTDVDRLVDLLKQDLHDNPYPIMNLQGVPLPELALRIFQITSKPLRLSDFVKIVGLIWGLGNENSPAEEVEEVGHERQASRDQSLILKIENRQTLRFLLHEIGELPLHQRKAVLYSLKVSKRSALLLIYKEGIADADELSAMLGNSKKEFELMVLNELPLGDVEIGRRLGVTAEKARNFRKCGLERIYRRLEAHEKTFSNSTKSTFSRSL